MAKLKIQYDPNLKKMPYIIGFKSCIYAPDEIVVIRNNFEGCLHYVMGQFEIMRWTPLEDPLCLEVNDKLPEKQKSIIEKIVGLYNRSPELYDRFTKLEYHKN